MSELTDRIKARIDFDYTMAEGRIYVAISKLTDIRKHDDVQQDTGELISLSCQIREASIHIEELARQEAIMDAIIEDLKD